jgi:hypothetical protein
MADDTRTDEQLAASILAHGHAVQSGVAFLMSIGAANDTTPKHLRVGVNSALVESGALAELLIGKGLITRTEYLRMLDKYWAEEHARYERECYPVKLA